MILSALGILYYLTKPKRFRDAALTLRFIISKTGSGKDGFLKTSQEGIDLIKFFEGFRAERYRDSGGIDTIGYGHAIRPGKRCPRFRRKKLKTY